MENNELKNLIKNTEQTAAKTETTYTPSTTGISTEDINKLFRAAPTQLTPINPQQGWQCPVCGAVMSPWTSVCINCHGNWNYGITWKYNPYEVTCKTKSDSST